MLERVDNYHLFYTNFFSIIKLNQNIIIIIVSYNNFKNMITNLFNIKNHFTYFLLVQLKILIDIYP